jgi:hypothetical protein
MNGQVTNINHKSERDGMDTSEFNPAAGDALQLCDHAAAYHRLEGVGSYVPSQAAQTN